MSKLAEGGRSPVEERVLIDRSHGCEVLEARVIRYAAGSATARTPDDRQDVLYVAEGRGAVEADGDRHELAQDTGVFIPAGTDYTIDNTGDGDLVLFAVSAPSALTGGARAAAVRFDERPSLPASPNREFRYLVNQDAGCLDVTQFVGIIPPGRPGMHSHTYDEIVFVVEGEGVLHREGKEPEPLAPGSCMHLPPLAMHALENTGPTPMRVLGVFHPSGDPASRAREEH